MKIHKGALGFEEAYQEIYQDRWPHLKKALLEEKQHIAVASPLHQHAKVPPHELDFYPGAFLLKEKWSEPFFYFLDAASLLPIMALELKSGENVLDLCAAPGGKSLLMSFKMKSEGKLTANDRSLQRRERLKNNLEHFLGDKFHHFVSITGYEAQKWGLHHPNSFDKVLLDAPCSSERHVLMDSKELKNWSPKRPKKLAQDQFSMLCSAFSCLRPGGRLVYSTCSMHPMENDEVIEKFTEKRKEMFVVIKKDFPIGEATKWGWRVLPDREGWGPFYLSIIEKRI